MEAGVNRNYERIMELEGQVRKMEDGLKDSDTEVNQLGIHITNIYLDVEGDHLVIRTNQYLWDQIS